MSPLSQIWSRWRIDGIGLSACLLMLALLVLGGLRPLARRHADHHSQTEALVREQDGLRAAQAAMSKLERKLDACRRELAGSSIQLAPVSSLNLRMGKLVALAGEMQLKVNETSSGSPAATEHYLMVPIRLIGTGSYDRCTRFLHHLRERFPDTGVNRVELTGNPDGTGLFRLELRWYASPTT